MDLRESGFSLVCLKLVLSLMVVVPYIGSYGTFANSSEQEGLKELISSGDCLSVLVFKSRVVSPEVKVNGTDVPQCDDQHILPCKVENRVIFPPNFCTSDMNVTVYYGTPPSPRLHNGLELCHLFLHGCWKPPAHVPEGISCHYEYFGIPCSFCCFGMIIGMIIGIGIGIGIGLFWFFKRSKHKIPRKLACGIPTQVEGGADDEKPVYEPNNNGDFIHAMESILRDARNGVPMDQSLKQELLTTLLRHRTVNAGISYDQINEEEGNPRVPVDSETIVDLDKTEAVIPPCDNTVIRRNLSVRSDTGRSGEVESHVVINIPEEISPKSFTGTSGGYKSIGIDDDD